MRTTINEDEAFQQARILAAIAEPVRLRILRLLSQHEGKINVESLVTHFNLRQSTISSHLAILLRAELITVRKQGLHHFYSVDKEAMARAEAIIHPFTQ